MFGPRNQKAKSRSTELAAGNLRRRHIQRESKPHRGRIETASRRPHKGVHAGGWLIQEDEARVAWKADVGVGRFKRKGKRTWVSRFKHKALNETRGVAAVRTTSTVTVEPDSRGPFCSAKHPQLAFLVPDSLGFRQARCKLEVLPKQPQTTVTTIMFLQIKAISSLLVEALSSPKTSIQGQQPSVAWLYPRKVWLMSPRKPKALAPLPAKVLSLNLLRRCLERFRAPRHLPV